MKTVCDVNKCTGCKACLDICRHGAIRIRDSIKAYNAIIDENVCLDCDACHKVCQVNNSPKVCQPIYWCQGWAEDKAIREGSSSGGFAAAIELEFVRMGGSVASCNFKNGRFKFAITDDPEAVKSFAGSKYVKSDPEGIYRKIAEKLKSGEKVLFVGLPCQAAAVKNYVGDKENLYTIDLICHGTPSPTVLNRFLEDYNCELSDLANLSFRMKTRYYLQYNNRTFTVPTVQDYYSMTFLRGVSYTENCYECRYARKERVSDVTLGDSWGSDLSENEKEKGISLALCQTEKGIRLLEIAKLNLIEVGLEKAIENNQQLKHPSLKSDQRERFMDKLFEGASFNKAIRECYPIRYAKDIVKTLLYKLGGA